MSNQSQPPASARSGSAAAPSNNAVVAKQSNNNNASYRLPSNVCIGHAMKLAIVEDKPIMMDYWTASLDKSVIIGVSENKDKLLVKSEDEYTSTIAKIYKVETEYIIMTENSIYIVSNDIPTKRIN
jgi:hypothetical protein